MNPLQIPFVTLLGLAAALPAQDPQGQRRSPVQNKQDLTADYALVQREPDALWGLGRNYSVRFHDDRVEFVPHLSSSPVTQSVVLQADTVGRGTARAPFVRATGAVEQGRRVSYLHEQATEVYDVRPDGMKQSFVFATLPAGEGDLVVTCKLTTALPLQQQDAGSLAFGDEHGGVRLAGVVGIDAAGHRVDGSMALHDGVLSLRLPASFVQSATLPLELDPVLSTTSLFPSSVRIHEIEAAYDVSTNTYLVVWGSSVSGNSSEIRGYLQPGGPVLIEPAAQNRNVGVANCNARDCFVVTWDTPRPFTIGQRDVLRVRVLRPGQLGTSIDFPGFPSLSVSEACIGSNESASDDRMLMVHQTASPYLTTPGQQSAALTTFQITPSLGLFVAPSPTTTISAGNVNATGTGISRSDDGQDRYLVAVGEEYPVGTHRLRAGVYDAARNAILPSAVVPAPAAENGEFWEIAIDGSTGNWLVAATTSDAQANRDPWYTQAEVSGTLLLLSQPSILYCPVGTEQLDVASTSRLHAVAYQVRGYTGPSCGASCFVAGISLLTARSCMLCGEYEEYEDSTVAAFARPAANGDNSAAAAETVKLFYADNGSQPTGAVVFVADYVPNDGIAVNLGGGCGNLTATASWSCAKVGNALFGTTFEAALANAPANAFLVLSTDRLDASGCGTCTLVPNLWNGFVLPPPPLGGSNGTTVVHTITMPIDPAAIGVRFYQQWLALAPSATGCPSLGINLSNALRLEVQ